MDRVTSRDDTPIAYERSGGGPAVILVGGGLDDGTENAPAGSPAASPIQRRHLRASWPGREWRYAAVRGRARDRGSRGADRDGRGFGSPVRRVGGLLRGRLTGSLHPEAPVVQVNGAHARRRGNASSRVSGGAAIAPGRHTRRLPPGGKDESRMSRPGAFAADTFASTSPPGQWGERPIPPAAAGPGCVRSTGPCL